ncbi:protein draper-like [Vespa mandarinia]|uniref:protein draper-like n=1 Tax=Vespa mandarinia TaxID=7446 RepID=UPI0016224643|nr:protein draper-like [Vespa mandarinia]
MNVFGEWLFLLWTIKASYSLSTDHICTRTENYTVTSMETYVQPVVVNTFTWCLQVPPRCPRTRTEMRQRYRIKSEIKTRKVKECCEGYKLEIRDKKDGDASCVPFCENCLAGTCISPNKCQCDPGYQGTDCSKDYFLECPPGLWGVQCMEKCECAEDVICDFRNGTCCPSGFWGPRCEQNCPPQRWGRGCKNFCNCKGHINHCHPETGHCTFTVTDIHSTSKTTNAVQLLSTKIIEFKKRTTDLSWTTDHVMEEGWDNYVTPSSTDSSFENTNSEPISQTDSNVKIKTHNQENDITSTSTIRPLIVLVSVPERQKTILTKDRSKFALKDTFLRHLEEKGELRDDLPLKTDYVETIHKENVTPAASIRLDVALIIIASIIFLSLMSIAIMTIIHTRTKLFETVRLSIYNDEKEKNSEHESEKQRPPKRISTIIDSALPHTCTYESRFLLKF